MPLFVEDEEPKLLLRWQREQRVMRLAGVEDEESDE